MFGQKSSERQLLFHALYKASNSEVLLKQLLIENSKSIERNRCIASGIIIGDKEIFNTFKNLFWPMVPEVKSLCKYAFSSSYTAILSFRIQNRKIDFNFWSWSILYLRLFKHRGPFVLTEQKKPCSIHKNFVHTKSSTWVPTLFLFFTC